MEARFQAREGADPRPLSAQRRRACEQPPSGRYAHCEIGSRPEMPRLRRQTLDGPDQPLTARFQVARAEKLSGSWHPAEYAARAGWFAYMYPERSGGIGARPRMRYGPPLLAGERA